MVARNSSGIAMNGTYRSTVGQAVSVCCLYKRRALVPAQGGHEAFFYPSTMSTGFHGTVRIKCILMTLPWDLKTFMMGKLHCFHLSSLSRCVPLRGLFALICPIPPHYSCTTNVSGMKLRAHLMPITRSLRRPGSALGFAPE